MTVHPICCVVSKRIVMATLFFTPWLLLLTAIIPLRADVESRRIFAIAQPATVRIRTNNWATVSVPEISLSQQSLERLRSEALNAMERGELSDNEQARVDWVIRKMAADPFAYFTPGVRKEDTLLVYGHATGFIVTPSGFVVTNAHAVSSEGEEFKKDVSALLINSIKGMNPQSSASTFSQGTTALTREQAELVREMSVAWLTRYLRVERVSTTVTVIRPKAGQDRKTVAEFSEASIVTVGEPFPGKDIAVLKIIGLNLPSLPMSRLADAEVGDEVFVVGYPSDVEFDEFGFDGSFVQPRLAKGNVTSLRRAPGGWIAIEIDAPLEMGNSGSPVFDSSGDIVGIATAGRKGLSTGNPVPGVGFLVPTSVAFELLDDAGVEPTAGESTRLYMTGLDKYYAQHYRTAISYFDRVKSISPDYPGVQSLIDSSRRGIAAGRDESWHESIGYYVLAAIVLLIIVGLLLKIHRGRGAATLRPIGAT